ncbi:MAG: response regulator [Kouleothrix sp.]|nr:response regulator [Kouleothrix sp.]
MEQIEQTITILIVDDEPAGRETLAALLRKDDYRLAFASDGPAALERAAALHPDVVLLDVMMPGLDGYQVCRQIRADPQLAEIPIIMVTALDGRESRLAGIDAGADDFLTKPYDRVELRARIRAITRLNRYRRLLHERDKFERAIRLAPNGLLIVDAAGTVCLANPALLRMLGLSADTIVVGQPLRAYIAADQIDRLAAELCEAYDDPARVVRLESALLAGGRQLPVEIDAGYIEWNERPAAQVSVRDISDRKAYEAHLGSQMDRLAGLRAIDSAVASSMDLTVTLSVVLDQIVERLQVDGAAVLLRRPHEQKFDYALVRGIGKRSLRQSSLRLGQGYAGRVALERRILALGDLCNIVDLAGPLDRPVAAYYGIPLVVKGQVEGVLEIFHWSPLVLDAEWLEFLEILAGQTAIAIDHAALFDSMQRAHAELAQAYTSTLEGWARALELRDKETEGHAQRVTELTVALARSMGFSESELVHIRRGALLHDIGKMGVPDSILLKPGPLTAEEWVIMRQHPVYAYEMLVPITYLRLALDIPYCHHEKWDGSGYPRGLQGEQIPLSARIFSVVDVWDALRFDRPYRKGWPEDRVREHIREQSGTHFDPQVVAAFLKLQVAAASEAQLAILAVDDDPTILETLRRALHDLYTVYTAGSGVEALDVLERETIAVIITDQRMPGLTGVQLLERARHISPDTLGILSSGYFDDLALSDALNLGTVRGYVHKPWNLTELRRRVNEVVQQYRESAKQPGRLVLPAA